MDGSSSLWRTGEEALHSDGRPEPHLGLARDTVAMATPFAASCLTPCTEHHLHYYPQRHTADY